MVRKAVGKLLGRLLSAVVIGVATLFVPKVDPAEHWAVPPTMEFRSTATQADPSGGPPA